MNFTRYKLTLLTLLITGINAGEAAELSVNIKGATNNAGLIGCSLYASEIGFPMEGEKGIQQWKPADSNEVTCEFKDIAPGKYAVSVMQDMNSNKKVDTNFLGIPKEPWGVSNNVRPNLRAPKFSEAAFDIEEDGILTIEVEIAK